MHYLTTHTTTSRFDKWTAIQRDKLEDATLVTHQTDTFVNIITLQVLFQHVYSLFINIWIILVKLLLIYNNLVFGESF